MKYEDLQDDLPNQIQKIAHFLDKPLTPNQIKKVVINSSRKAMKAAENRGSPLLNYFSFARAESSRREFEADLTPELKNLIAARSAAAMEIFGYQSDHP